MILVRLMKAVREQNWFAVAIEFVIVILGVVIGFQVSLMAQEHAERGREADFLLQLDRELTAIIGELDTAQSEVDAYYARISTFIEGVQTGDQARAQEGAWGLVGITEVVSVNLEPAALSELISSGELGIITNRELRAALASIPQIQASSESRLSQMTLRLAPAAEAISMRIEIDLPEIEDFSTWSYTTDPVRFDLETIAQDQAFLRQLNYAGFQNRVLENHLRRRGAAIEAILDQVRAEIDRQELT